jgi:serine/threonine-protein kinase RsbW
MGVGGSNRREGRGPRKSRPRNGASAAASPLSGAGTSPRSSRRAATTASNEPKSKGTDNHRVERLAFNIPSNLERGREVQQHILDSAQRHGFDGQVYFAIKLALEEAIINAIKHGNKLDPDKHVEIEAGISSKRLTVTIEDQGPGFERAHVPDPTIAENLEKCSGRGILLIEHYMTKVRWDRGGRRVTLTKEREG